MNNSEAFFQYQAQTTPFPIALEITKAEGCYLYDSQDKQFLDLVGGIAVNNIGHCHPKVVKAVQEQAAKFMHVMPYGEYVQAPQSQLARLLAANLPAQLQVSYFVNSGTEANEAAIKLAKRATGRTEIVSFHKSYHGNTHGSLSISGNEAKKFAFRPLLPDVRFITFNDIEDLQHITTKTAGVIIEPIQGDAGVRRPTDAFMQELRKRCTEVGALLIFDEIQTGIGRTGTLFAFEQFGVVPDILTLGKALGGGMPIGAFVASRTLMDCWTDAPMLGHITTFGGHPISCIAAKTGLDVLFEENIIPAVQAKGRLFKSLLQHPAVKEFRHAGLMMAVELESPERVQQVVEYCRKKGVLAFWFLSCTDSFRMQPPLTISEEQIRVACAVIVEGLEFEG
jgi:acetylornithine/N-succinyldiaminopimelate aminotransferase